MKQFSSLVRKHKLRADMYYPLSLKVRLAILFAVPVTIVFSCFLRHVLIPHDEALPLSVIFFLFCSVFFLMFFVFQRFMFIGEPKEYALFDVMLSKNEKQKMCKNLRNSLRNQLSYIKKWNFEIPQELSDKVSAFNTLMIELRQEDLKINIP